MEGRKFARKKLTLSVRLDGFFPDGVSDDALAAKVAERLTDWDDGRYPFLSEVITDALGRVVSRAAEYLAGRDHGTLFLGCETDSGFTGVSIEPEPPEAP